jgi:anti-anti-sigma factor
MALKITNREVDGVTVLALDGRIVLGDETKALRETVKGMLAHNKKLVLNMEHVTHIDSNGIGTLVEARSSANSRGAALRLCNVRGRCEEILRIAGLPPFFDVLGSEADAVHSFPR